MFQNKPKFGPEMVKAGSDIIHQGDEPDKFYIIVKGSVAVVSQPPGESERELAVLGPGDYFGEVGMVLGSLRLATVRALTDVNLMVMDAETFRHWVDSSPMIADEIHSLVAQRLPAEGALELIEGELHLTLDKTLDVPDTAVTSTEVYAHEEYIVRQDEKADKFYIIIDGFVAVTRITPDGEEYNLAHLTVGDYFGEIGLLDGSPRIANVKALTPVRVVSFDRETFRQWMNTSPANRDEIEETARKRLYDTGMLSQPEDEQD